MRDNRRSEVAKTKPSVAETYKILQMRMDSVVNASNMKVIAFTSVVHCEEKSELICNIAKSMVLEDKNILVIDCNIDNPNIHHYFGIELKTLLFNARIHNENKWAICKAPEMPRLNFVPCSRQAN